MRVRFEDEASSEYGLASLWYERQRPHLGSEFLDAVDAAIRHIVAAPHSGHLVPGLRSSIPARRLAVPRFPYHVVYLEAAGEIRILAIAHDRRRPRYWKARAT